MQKVIRKRRSSNSANVGQEFWNYYRALDREIKADFAFEVMEATGWEKSTFYTRMKNGTGWKSQEVTVVQSIFKKYKKMYAYE